MSLFGGQNRYVDKPHSFVFCVFSDAGTIQVDISMPRSVVPVEL